MEHCFLTQCLKPIEKAASEAVHNARARHFRGCRGYCFRQPPGGLEVLFADAQGSPLNEYNLFV